MTTLERYFIEDKETHKEVENSYFSYRNSEKICRLILEEFGLFSQESRMVNGHTPVKTGKGESLFVVVACSSSLMAVCVKLIKKRLEQQDILC